MAEEIKVTVDYVGNLKEVVNATKSLKLTEGQSEKVAKHEKGAQLALEAGDLKQFQKHFNALMGIFKDAAAATGQLSSALKTLTDRQADLNKKINELETKKTGLKNQLADDGSGKLNADAAKKFHAESETAKKVTGLDGTEMARDALIKAQEALVKYLEQHNKTLSTLTNADAQAVGFQDRRSAQAANRYVQEEIAAGNNIQKEVTSTEGEINTLTTEYNEVSTELKSLTTAANQTTEALNTLYQKINSIGNQTNNAITKETNDISSANINKTAATGSGIDAASLKSQPMPKMPGLSGAFKQFSIYAVAAKALKTAIREAVKTITELDKYLTEQAMVTGRTREQTYKLVGSYQDLASQCGATTKEVAQVATEYMKQGKTVADSLVLTEAAIKAAKVAGVSVGDSVNYLTTALNGFRLAADQAMAVSDKFAAIAASSATDYDELAIALSKVASQANLAGMSIDYTTALLAKGLETTREAPETMGTALKTIIARMRELSDYGETLGGDTDINKVESQLSYVGIALRDTSGELRSTEDVLDELGKKWDDLSKNQQAAVAKALAGTRQQARLIAMMEDYERVTELQQISARSAGATSAQASTYLEGMAAATNNIKVAWEKLVMNLSNSKVIIGAFQTIGKTLDGIANLMDHVVVQVPVFAVMGTMLLSSFLTKVREHALAKEQHQLQLEMQVIETERAIREREHAIDMAKTVELKKLEGDLTSAQNEEQIASEALVNAMMTERAANTEYQTALEEEQSEQEIENAIEMQVQENIAAAQREKQIAQENEILAAKLQQKAANGELTAEEQQQLQQAKATAKEARNKQKTLQQEIKKGKDSLKQQKQKTKQAKNETKQKKTQLDSAKKATAEARKELESKQAATKEAQYQVDAKNQDIAFAERTNTLEKEKLDLLKQQAGQVGFLESLWGNVGAVMSIIPGIQGAITLAQTIINALTKKEGQEIDKNDKKRKKGLITLATEVFGKIVSAFSQLGPWGAVAGIALGAAIAAAIGVGIAAGAGAFSDTKKQDDAGSDVKALSAEIYKLEESAQAIDTTANHFENLDKKVLKTKEDIQAMEEDLAKLGESMSEEAPDTGKNASEYDKEMAKITGGKSEKEHYESLRTEEEKIEFARQKAELQRQEADRKRDEQVDRMNKLSVDNQKELLKKDKEVRDAFYAYNRNQLYDYIDEMKTGAEALSEEEAQFLETSTQAILDNMDAWDAYEWSNNPEKIRQLTDTLKSVTVSGKNALEVLNGIAGEGEEEISLSQKVKAYEKLRGSLEGAAQAAFDLQYQEFLFWTQLDDKALDTLDSLNISNDGINEIYGEWERINELIIKQHEEAAEALGEDLDMGTVQLFTEDEYQNLMHGIWGQLNDDLSNFDQIMTDTFGSMVEKGTEAWGALINVIGDQIAIPILDMGQQMEAFNNQINSFYEKASGWGDLNEAEKMEFVADNAELFSGEGGAAMLEAFESGDYDKIETALAAQMAEDTQEKLEDVRRTLAVEMARVGDDRNEAYIKALQEYEAYLMDTDKLYEASLELQLEKEQAQLDEYRSYLEKEQEALEESLEKRKEAYESYFDSLEQEEEDQDYEEQASRLITNLSKLGSSSNADAKAKTAELEQQLEELEKERLQTLRERAREAVLDNIDSQIEEISEKFDKLLESNRALLAAMQGDLADPQAFIGDLIASKASEGGSELEIESYLKQLESVYGSTVGKDFFKGIDVREENGQLILNVNGQEVILSSDDEQSVYTAVMTALKQIGKH